MEYATVGAIVLASLVVKGAAILVLAYVGARLAIRHERRSRRHRVHPRESWTTRNALLNRRGRTT